MGECALMNEKVAATADAAVLASGVVEIDVLNRTNKRTLIRIVVVVGRGGCGGDDEEGGRLRLWWRVDGGDGDGEVAVAVCSGDREARGGEWWRMTWGIG
ncbi:hypothetical protein Tco_0123668 [Tanacetum coccineum]